MTMDDGLFKLNVRWRFEHVSLFAFSILFYASIQLSFYQVTTFQW